MVIIKKLNLNNVFTEALCVIIGVVLIIWPTIAVTNICYIAGIIVAAIGICYVVDYFRVDVEESFKKKNLAYGISCVIGAIVIFLREEDIAQFIPVILGFVIIISSIMKFQDSVDFARMGFESWYVILVIAIVNFGFGILLTLNPFVWENEQLNLLLGIGLIFSGVTDIVLSVILSRFFTKHKDDIASIEENRQKTKELKKQAKEDAKEAKKAEKAALKQAEKDAKKQAKADAKNAARAAKEVQKEAQKEAKKEANKEAGQDSGKANETLSKDEAARHEENGDSLINKEKQNGPETNVQVYNTPEADTTVEKIPDSDISVEDNK